MDCPVTKYQIYIAPEAEILYIRLGACFPGNTSSFRRIRSEWGMVDGDALLKTLSQYCG